MKTMTQLLHENAIKTVPANRSSRLQPESAVFTRAIWCSLVIFGAALLLVQAAIADPGQWEFTGSLKVKRTGHQAALLSDGRVLVVGGSGFLASAEVYDPTTDRWTRLAPLPTPRDHVAAWAHEDPARSRD